MQFKYALTTLALSVPALAGERIYPRRFHTRANDGGDLQKSLSLDPSLVQPASATTGQEVVVAGQVDSLQSTNNFINYCDTLPDVPLTNGEQIFEGSCNQIPMGQIMAKNVMPSQKVAFPKNGDVIPSGTDITFLINVKNLITGHFTNAQLTYYAAPSQLDPTTGFLIGHSHITVDAIASLDDTTPSDIQQFTFFKGLNDAAINGQLNATAVGGLKAGFYRACTLGSNSNHAPVVPPVANRASENDCIRFTVSDDAPGAVASSTAPAAASTSTAAAAGTGAGAAGAGAGKGKGGKTGAAGKAGKGQQKGGKRSNLSSGRRSFSASRRSRIARDD